MAKLQGSYETVMIFNTQQGEEGIAALSERFKKLISDNGTIDKVEEWGKRRLAYPIDDEMDGYYLLVQFTSKPDFPAELDRVYKITDGVLRTLIVERGPEDEKKPEQQPQAPAPAPAPAPTTEEQA